MYGSIESPSLYDLEALLYVQEAQLEKFRQELIVSTIATNIAHTIQETNNYRGSFLRNHGRGNRFTRGRNPDRCIIQLVIVLLVNYLENMVILLLIVGTSLMNLSCHIILKISI